jgi:predicted NUDIX family phosphoesterase
MAQEEQVLVIERKVLDEVGMFQGLMFDVDQYLKQIFVPDVPRYMPRSQAENDPNYKQIIPYVIMAHEEKYLSYVRGKRTGEGRLKGLGSIGIGGHINPVDDMPLFCNDFRESYLSAVKREVEEEVHVDTTYTDRIVALLNDDSNEVGQVHLGIVHCWFLDAAKVSKREQMITQMSFMSPAELQGMRENLETWSSLCLDGLTQITEPGKTGTQSNVLSGASEGD